MISYHIASTWQLEVPLQVMQLSKAGKTRRQGRWKRPTIWLIWDASPVHPIKPPWTVWRSSVFCCWYVRVHELLKTLTIQNFSVVAAGPHDCSDSKTSEIFPWMLANISSPRFDLWNTQRGLSLFHLGTPPLPCWNIGGMVFFKHGKPGRNKTTVVEAETFFLKTREDGRTHSRYRLIDTAASFVWISFMEICGFK